MNALVRLSSKKAARRKVGVAAVRTAAVEALAGGKNPICITKAQRNVHVFFEALAVFLVAPFNFWLASRPELPKPARTACAVVGATTLVVDGGLLLQYLKQKEKK